MKIEAEDFSAWRDNPVTEQVFVALRKLADKAKAHWLATSWDQGSPDPLVLADLRARFQVANDLADLTFEELEEMLRGEQERDSANGVQVPDQGKVG